MPRTIGRLSTLAVSRAKERGRYADGGGLYLQVSASGTKSWVYRFMLNGKAREMGLGSIHTYSLAEARQKAADCRKSQWEGVDPIETRRASRAAARLKAAKAITFQDAAKRYCEAHRAGWKNKKHADQWTNTLTKYAYPEFGSKPVQSVDVKSVMKVLEPIWGTKTETARRLRGRIEAILDWAKTLGYRDGENPARWHGHLENLLPKKLKELKTKHFAALPYAEIGVFMSALRQRTSTAARAMEFLILTGARTGETIGARWSEIDLDQGIWVVPADRMKAGREHRVPLSAPALTLLRKLNEIRLSEYVFPGVKHGSHLSNMSLLELLKRMKRTDITVHGFRSTFRDWAAEQSAFPAEVVEMALAHAISNKVEAAYRRGDLFEKRRKLMDAWADHCDQARPTGEVVPFTATAA